MQVDHGLAILTTVEMALADGAAIAAGTAGRVLMERAGAAVAAAITARWTPRQAVALCGPGANGGDGFVVARLLVEAGWTVRVALASQREALAGDAALAAADWTGETQAIGGDCLDGAQLVVDALFGAGLSRPLAPELAAILEAAQARALPIVAVDLPSGLSGDTGRPLGRAPACELTVTFHRKKPAHVLEPGRSLCGELVVADIGLAAPQGTALLQNGPALWLEQFPWPATDAHKYARGALGVVSGPALQTGAARLASRAGLRLAGAVRVYAPAEAALVLAAHLEAVMLKAFTSPAELERFAAEVDAMVIGPGAGLDEGTAANLEALSRWDAALVVDADALSVFKPNPQALFALLSQRDVLTPHAGEFDRVFPGLLASSPERITAAREASKRAGAVVILKGPDTVIAEPGGRAVVNVNGSPWLATAGSGDVLAGVAGGLLAARMATFEAACAAVWIHAAAGAAFGPGLTAEDLPGALPEVLRELQALSPDGGRRASPG